MLYAALGDIRRDSAGDGAYAGAGEYACVETDMGGSATAGLGAAGFGFNGKRGGGASSPGDAPTRKPPAWKSKVMETSDFPSRLSKGMALVVKSFNISLCHTQNYADEHEMNVQQKHVAAYFWGLIIK